MNTPSSFVNISDLHPSEPIDIITFDCDGTLSQIEGIDFLAHLNGVTESVQQLTEQAMGGAGITPTLYQQRLALTRPTEQQVKTLGAEYFQHLTPDVDRVISLLQSLNKKIYIISAGIQQGVIDFGMRLNIPSENIFAVEIFFDEQGYYQGFDHATPLIQHAGKAAIIQTFKNSQRVAHIGDGMNDADAAFAVERFIGYGGVVPRKAIADLSDFYITARSLRGILPLCLTQNEYKMVPPSFRQLCESDL